MAVPFVESYFISTWYQALTSRYKALVVIKVSKLEKLFDVSTILIASLLPLLNKICERLVPLLASKNVKLLPTYMLFNKDRLKYQFKKIF